MTTKNITSIGAARDTLIATANEAAARRKMLAANKASNVGKRTALDEQQELVLNGTHVVLMGINDERTGIDVDDEVIEEELSQLDPNYFKTTPAPEPIPTPTAPEPTPTAVIVPNEPQESLGLEKVQTVVIDKPEPKTKDAKTTILFLDYISGWRGLAWVLALVFGIGAALLMLTYYDGFFPSRPDFLRIPVALVIPIASFFIGGFIGSMFEQRKARAVKVVA